MERERRDAWRVADQISLCRMDAVRPGQALLPRNHPCRPIFPSREQFHRTWRPAPRASSRSSTSTQFRIIPRKYRKSHKARTPTMPRKVAFSHRKKKEQLLRKRAIKRGDIDPSDAPTTHSDRRRRPRVQHSTADNAVVESARKLQSAFVKLPKEFLQQTRLLSASLPLQRPIPSQAAIWTDAVAVHDDDAKSHQLTCPRRPKWRYDMSKKEVEKNEEGLFKKWIDQTDALVDAWSEPDVSSAVDSPDKIDVDSMPRAPTTFERNLEVWRQL